jgi:hypothetical protein
MISTQALQAAAGALQRISDETPGERGRRASVVALVLVSLEAVVAGREAGTFLARRAEKEMDRLSDGAERAILERLLRSGGCGGEVVSELLRDYGAGLEEARRLPEAEAVIGLARELAPERADLALMAGRLARLQGNVETALSLYRTASELDGNSGTIARLAAVGEAAISDAPEGVLGLAIRGSIRTGDQEAAAVGLEERARVRRAAGDRGGAARDLSFAAARYADPVDRARVAHELADLFVACGDTHAAREVLFFALEFGDRTQRDHARSRLHTVSRELGDQVGMRRWRSFKPPALVSLSSNRTIPVERSAAPAIARWRERMVERLGT